MSLLRRSRRQGMIIGAAVGSSRARRQAGREVPPAAPVPAASKDDSIEQIKKFAELHEQGILTDAEFEAKKKQLLGL